MDIASWAGSGAGLIVIGAAWVLMFFNKHFPSGIQPWVMRGVIVLMFMGGATVAVTVVGKWATRKIGELAGYFGGWGAAALVIGALFLIGMIIFGTWKFPSPKVAYCAAVVLIVLGAFSGGFFHDLNTQSGQPARQGTANIKAWLTGKSG